MLGEERCHVERLLRLNDKLSRLVANFDLNFSSQQYRTGFQMNEKIQQVWPILKLFPQSNKKVAINKYRELYKNCFVALSNSKEKG